MTGCRTVIAHVTAPQSVVAVADARRRGADVWVETCPHYLCLTLEDCCAAYRRQWHDATMDIIQSESNLFGWIASSSSFLAGLTPSRAGA